MLREDGLELRRMSVAGPLSPVAPVAAVALATPVGTGKGDLSRQKGRGFELTRDDGRGGDGSRRVATAQRGVQGVLMATQEGKCAYWETVKQRLL